MDPKLNSSPASFLPAQLLHQKLLSFQQNTEDSSGGNGNQNFSHSSDPNLLNGQLSLLKSSLDDHSIEGDDDDDVTIPGTHY